ncbi:MAG: cytochrome c [Planctomycetota bacterium]
MKRLLPLAVLLAASLLTLLVASCATTAPADGHGKGGAELWAENCGRCHNLRSPASFSDRQWEIIALHMRVRANLTAEEHHKILEFLKSGN